MKTLLLLIPIAFFLLIAAILVRNLTPPGFSVHQVDTTDGSVVLSITPNYVVNSVRAITVTHIDGTLASRQGVFEGRTEIVIPKKLTSGTVLTVSCELQYDRWISACIETVEREFVIE